MTKSIGKVVGVNGNMVSVEVDGQVSLNEVGYIILGDQRLKSEVIRIKGSKAEMQVFEMTTGIGIGNAVEFTGELLAVELGPGLLTQIFDGLQNPLPQLADKCGFFLQRGVYLNALPRNKKWDFTPLAKAGDTVTDGDSLGFVPEGIFQHQIMVPFNYKGSYKVKKIADAGSYTVEQEIAVIVNEEGQEHSVRMMFTWPVKRAIT